MLFESQVPEAIGLPLYELLEPVECDEFREPAPKCECGCPVEAHCTPNKNWVKYFKPAKVPTLFYVGLNIARCDTVLWHPCRTCGIEFNGLYAKEMFTPRCTGYWRKA